MVCTFQSPQKSAAHVKCPGKGAIERVLKFYRMCVCTAKSTPSFQCVHPFPEKSQEIASKSTHIRVCVQLDNTRSECSINFNLNCYTSGVTFFGSGGVLLSLEAFFGEFLYLPSPELESDLLHKVLSRINLLVQQTHALT